jgi:hypothetical protein
MNFTLEAGGIFLFVAGMMYLSLTGRLGDMFRDRAVGQLLLVTLVTGLAIYHWGGMLLARANMPEEAPEPPASIPAPALPSPAPHRATRPPSRNAPTVEEPTPAPLAEDPPTVIVQEAPPTVLLAPPAVVPPSSGPDPYESKAKRGIRAVGRFLHLAKKTNN